MSRARLTLQRVGFVAALLLLWEAATGGFGLPPLLEPIIVARPSSAVAEIGAYAATGLLAKDLAATLQATSIGLTLGIVGGVTFGLLLGYARGTADTVEPVLIAFNSLPRIALAPVLVIAFGLGITMKSGSGGYSPQSSLLAPSATSLSTSASCSAVVSTNRSRWIRGRASTGDSLRCKPSARPDPSA